MFKDFGATNITLLHTKDRKVANSEAFVEPITTAKIVWFVGGQRGQCRFVPVGHFSAHRVLEGRGATIGTVRIELD